MIEKWPEKSFPSPEKSKSGRNLELQGWIRSEEGAEEAVLKKKVEKLPGAGSRACAWWSARRRLAVRGRSDVGAVCTLQG